MERPRFERYGVQTALGLAEELHRPGSRREVLWSALKEASMDPHVWSRGLDTAKFEDDLRSKGRLPARGEPLADRQHAIFLTRFRPDEKYVPLAARHIEGVDIPKVYQDIAEIIRQIPRAIEQLVPAVEGQMSAPPEERILVGSPKPDATEAALGGYHSPLEEQGYKLLDDVVVTCLPESPERMTAYEYRDALRSVVHDVVHSMQFKRLSRISTSREFLGEAEYAADAMQRRMNREVANREFGSDSMEAEAEDADASDAADRWKRMNLRIREADVFTNQYGSIFTETSSGKLNPNRGALTMVINGESKKFGISLDAALFEYLTDRVARAVVHRWMDWKGMQMPEPRTDLEWLMQQDFFGRQVPRSIKKEFPKGSRARNVAKIMAKYGEDILGQAEYTLDAFADLRPEVERAILDASYTGKLNGMQLLGQKLEALEYVTPAGKRLDRALLRKLADHAVCLRPLVKGLERVD